MKKYEAVIAYIVNRFNQEGVKKTKIFKLLWFAHREFMYLYSKELSELKFIRLNYGPVPKLAKNNAQDTNKKHDRILEDMVRDGILKVSGGNYTCLKEPMNLSDTEIAVIDQCLNAYGAMSAAQLSEVSHDRQWSALENGDIMLVEGVFARDFLEIGDDELERMRAQYQ
ncbi:Panacea domain-containing protein [Helicobacter sp.]|uniref:Panacea domain-containing protein n=1 Tax=Helicobacter sp. TaxID=218 RepID=UPI0025C2500F|nr:Panacea domain-containing protein [Helicobacter sp.]MCI5969170.1 Panacea domain-containing protein [Helicobacter sp.]